MRINKKVVAQLRNRTRKSKSDKIDEICDNATNEIMQRLGFANKKNIAIGETIWSDVWWIVYHAVKCEAKEVYYHAKA